MADASSRTQCLPRAIEVAKALLIVECDWGHDSCAHPCNSGHTDRCGAGVSWLRSERLVWTARAGRKPARGDPDALQGSLEGAPVQRNARVARRRRGRGRRERAGAVYRLHAGGNDEVVEGRTGVRRTSGLEKSPGRAGLEDELARSMELMYSRTRRPAALGMTSEASAIITGNRLSSISVSACAVPTTRVTPTRRWR